MQSEPTVSAGDIARLAGVGRAAVSNWRRRHTDFPPPVGGTASSPLFALPRVEKWLRDNGKSYALHPADLAWQRLRADTGDLALGESLAGAGQSLVDGKRAPGPVAELAAELGAAEAFEQLCARYLHLHTRRLTATPPELADLLVRLAGPAETVLDPACGTGTLLLRSGARRLLGQDADPVQAAITAVRARLRGADITVVTGDSLLADGFPDTRADVLLCHPPFNERTWGHAELGNDPRWEHGLPPRGESELAWLQHCLAHLRPGGTAAVLMPPAVASRRPGRRIRANLLRAGALRAICTIAEHDVDVWLMRRPEPGARPPSRVLLTGVDVARRWRTFRDSRDGDTDGAVPVIDLLDDDVDLSPARWCGAQDTDLAAGFAAARAELSAPDIALPTLYRHGDGITVTTVGELVRTGALRVHHSPARIVLGGGAVPVLTTDDLSAGRPPSSTTEHAEIRTQPGDVLASVTGVARVITDTGIAPGPGVTLYRADTARLDPAFLAGALSRTEHRATSGSSRIDVRRTELPRLPIERQRAYGAAFTALREFDDAARGHAERAHRLLRLGIDGLAGGALAPEPD